ncbi:unnamed protein product [Knipowitschia caucasica]
MESTNTRMDLQTKDIQELKTSLQFTQGEVDTLKEHNLKLTERTNTLQTDFYKVCDNLHIITDKLEYLEGQSRRNNLVFEGVLESPGETWADAEEKVKEILKEKLQLNHVVEVERAHRVGKPGGGSDWPSSPDYCGGRIARKSCSALNDSKEQKSSLTRTTPNQ